MLLKRLSAIWTGLPQSASVALDIEFEFCDVCKSISVSDCYSNDNYTCYMQTDITGAAKVPG